MKKTDFDIIKNERQLLGSMVYMEAAKREAFLNDVAREDFVIEEHRNVYDVLSKCHDYGCDMQDSLLRETLEKKITNGMLADLISLGRTDGKYYFNIGVVREHRVKAEMIAASEKLINVIDSGEINDVLVDMECNLKKWTTLMAGDKISSSEDVMNGVIESLKEDRDNTVRFQPKWPSLWMITGEFCSGDLVMIGGRPGGGKSAFAINLAQHAAKMGHNVGFFTLEMQSESLVHRLVAMNCDIPLSKFRSKMGPTEIRMVEEMAHKVSSLPIWFDPSAYRLEQILGRIRMLHEKNKCNVFFIDYLQIIQVNAKIDRYLQIKLICGSLKEIAKELGIIIVCLGQLNRTAGDEEPMMHHFREGGDIEHYSDVIVLLWKDEKGDINCKVEKNRQGQTGQVKLKFNGSAQTYSDPFYPNA